MGSPRDGSQSHGLEAATSGDAAQSRSEGRDSRASSSYFSLLSCLPYQCCFQVRGQGSLGTVVFCMVVQRSEETESGV